MSSLYDTTMKRETMVQKFEQLLAQYRAYFEEAGIDLDSKAPELMLYKEALRIYTSLPQMKNMDPLCIMEGANMISCDPFCRICRQETG